MGWIGGKIPESIKRYKDAPFVRGPIKLIDYKGQKCWSPATEDEFRNSESARLGIAPEKVVVGGMSETGQRIGDPAEHSQHPNAKWLSQFGQKIIEHEGQEKWAPASEEDYRLSESSRLGINPADVKVADIEDMCPCGQLQYLTHPCQGDCGYAYMAQPGFCQGVFDPNRKHFYCNCVHS